MDPVCPPYATDATVADAVEVVPPSPTADSSLMESSQSTPILRTCSVGANADNVIDHKDCSSSALPTVGNGESYKQVQRDVISGEETVGFEHKLREALTEISETSTILPCTDANSSVKLSDQPHASESIKSADYYSVQEKAKEAPKSFSDYFVEDSIIQAVADDSVDEMYISTKGPDDLPGLKAWTLVSVKDSSSGDVKWVVNLQHYFDLVSVASVVENGPGYDHDATMRSRLTLQRSKARRVRNGIVIFVL